VINCTRKSAITGRTRLVKKNYWASGVSPAVKRSCIDLDLTEIRFRDNAISFDCHVQVLSASQKKWEKAQENLNIMRIMDEEYTATPFTESPEKCAMFCGRRGYLGNRKPGTAGSCEKWGIQAIGSETWRSKAGIPGNHKKINPLILPWRKMGEYFRWALDQWYWANSGEYYLNGP